MKYLKKFNTINSYNLFKESDFYIRPNISKCLFENKIFYQKKISQDFMNLAYYWDAEDVSSGDWVDRIQNHILYKRGNPIKLNNNLVEVSLNNFYARQYDVELLLGDIWEIEIKFIIPVIPDKYSYIFDAGSLYDANHAFGLAISTSSQIYTNSKLAGNSTAPTYSINVPFDTYNKLCTVSIGMERYNETYNRHYVRYKDILYYSPNLVLRSNATFNNNFNRDYFSIGKGTNDSQDYQSSNIKYIKYIKIFKR